MLVVFEVCEQWDRFDRDILMISGNVPIMSGWVPAFFTSPVVQGRVKVHIFHNFTMSRKVPGIHLIML